jgi:FkbM family methyltransferase
MLRRLQSSLAYRAKWARLGIVYVRKPKLDSIRIAGRPVHLSLPETERATHEFEFGKIVFEDCYRLAKIDNACTVLDIGANIGLFTLAARNRFPDAIIHAYEPNPDIQTHLAARCDAVGAQRFEAAVGSQGGSISLKFSNEGSLHSVTQSGGSLRQVAFADAIAKLGTVDLLKLDCEGAEWDIFTDLRRGHAFETWRWNIIYGQKNTLPWTWCGPLFPRLALIK